MPSRAGIAVRVLVTLLSRPLPLHAREAARSAVATAVRDTTRLGVPFTRYTTRDRFERTITFYLEDVPESLKSTPRVLVLGHSEGAQIAPRVAVLEPRVTHLAPIGGAGATQLFELAEWFATPQPGDSAGASAARRAGVYAEWARIRRDPDSITKEWLGHPYRRWSSFLARNSLDDLLTTRAKLFLAHGALDTNAPVISFDWLRAELAVRGREAHVERIEGADHGFAIARAEPPGPGEPYPMEAMIARIIDWMLAKS